MTNDNYDPMFDAAGKYYNVDPQLLKTLFHMESGGNPNAPRGASGEIGPMQFMPGTANQMHVPDPTDMTQAIPAAAQIIRRALDDNHGDVAAAIQTYNGGKTGPNNPKTFAYVMKAQTLYPQMGLKTQTTQQNDPVANLGESILSGSAPAAPSAPPKPEADTGSSNPADAGEAILSQTNLNPAAPAPAPTNQQGRPDTIAPTMRNMLSQAPGFTYGNVLPLKRNNQTGQLSLAMPGMVTNFANGMLDLAEGPITGTVTPQGTMAMANLMMTNPQAFGSPMVAREGVANALTTQATKEAGQPGVLSQGFKSNPLSPDYAPNAAAGPTSPSGIGMLGKLDESSIPNANPVSPETSKFAALMHTAIADQIARGLGTGVGHLVSPGVGELTGFLAGPIIKDVVASYGPKVGEAVSAALSKRMQLDNLLNGGAKAGVKALPGLNQTQPQTKLGPLANASPSLTPQQQDEILRKLTPLKGYAMENQLSGMA